MTRASLELMLSADDFLAFLETAGAIVELEWWESKSGVSKLCRKMERAVVCPLRLPPRFHRVDEGAGRQRV